MNILFKLALLVGALMTFTGFAAPLIPHVDLINNFRPLTLLGCVVLFAWTIAAGYFRKALWAALLAAVNMPLFLVPILDAPGYRAETGRPAIKLITFNTHFANGDLSRVADYLERANADIVVLQELLEGRRGPFVNRLRKTYPHIHECDCKHQLLLSRQAWRSVGDQAATATQPSLIWANFADRAGKPFRVTAIHTAYPLLPWLQAAQYDWLTARMPRPGDPHILVGDFNATPWSWALTRFTWASGLQRAGTLLATWPGHWPVQAFLIDNVFTTPSITVRSFETGPDLGSDHRPVIATIELP